MADFFYRIVNGAKLPDISIEPLNIPSTDEFDALAGSFGTPSAANTYIVSNDPRILTSDQKAGLAGPLGFTPSAADVFATQSFVDAQIAALSPTEGWLDAATHSINYTANVGTTGAPPVVAGLITGEKALNTEQDELWEYNGVSWDAVAISADDRFAFLTSGGSGVVTGWSNTTDLNTIFEFDGTNFSTTSPVDGNVIYIIDQNRIYVFNGTSWGIFENSLNHNDLASIQGESTDPRHISQDRFDGLDNSITPITNSNKAIVEDNVGDRLVTKLSFAFRGGFSANTTQACKIDAGTSDGYVLPTTARVWKVIIEQDGAATSAGTLTARVTENGTPLASNTLDVVLDNATTGGFEIAETSTPLAAYLLNSSPRKLGVQLSSDASWTAQGQEIRVHVFIAFE